jgi:hypothetical protein
MFTFYFNLGIEHITDFEGYDHMLFLLALCAVYSFREWKKLLILVTAFTIGHSVTLALAALNIVKVNSDLIEFLIPVTIFLTALFNLLSFAKKSAYRLKYALALGFGLIHGLGFSNYFRAILGREADIVMPLFAFNVGVEAGQILVVLALLVISTIALHILNLSSKTWTFSVSLLAGVVSLYLAINAWPW